MRARWILGKAHCLGVAALVWLLFASASGRADTIALSLGWNPGVIQKFDSTGQGSVFASGLIAPGGLAFDKSGNLYAADSGNGQYGTGSIYRYNSNGNGSLFAGPASGVNTPEGLAFDSSGTLYVANHGNGTIEKFDPSGHGSMFAVIGSPFGLAFDSSSNLYVAAMGSPGMILKVDSSGHVSTFASGLNNPWGLAFDSTGNLYVANYGGGPGSNDGSIYRFDPNGNRSGFASGLYGPEGIAFDSNGNLFVAMEYGSPSNYFTGYIEEFDSSGNGSVFASGLHQPTFIAVQVPEPATWVLLALGIGALLGALRLPRRSS